LATPDEQKIINQIRKNCEAEIAAAPSAAFPEVTGDINLLRFLRGHEGNAANAETFFKKMLEWRIAKGVDPIRQEVYALWQKAGGRVQDMMTHSWLPHAEIVLRHYPERFYHKIDVLGNPVKITRQPFINDIPGLMKSLSSADYYHYRLARGELRALLLQELSVAQNKLVKMTFLWDLDGMELSYWSLLRSKEVVAYSSDYDDSSRDCYPEIAHKIVALNTPWFLNALWHAAKALLPARTLKKIQVYGADYISKLSELIPLQNIPDVMNGSCKCPEGCFPTNWQSETIAKSAKFTLDFALEAKSKITWEFQCKGSDIAFESKFVGIESGEQVVQSSQRYGGEVTRGSFTAPTKGSITLIFDNSFSWFTSKKVNYNVRILPFVSHESEEQIMKSDPLLSSPRADPDSGSAAAGGPPGGPRPAAATVEDDDIVG